MEKLNFSRKNKNEFEEANSIYYSFSSLSSQDSSHNISDNSLQIDDDKTIEAIIILDDSNDIENKIIEIPEKNFPLKLNNKTLNSLEKNENTSTPRKCLSSDIKKKIYTDNMSFSKSVCDPTLSKSKKILHSIENEECFLNEVKKNDPKITKSEDKVSSDDSKSFDTKSVQIGKDAKNQNSQSVGATSHWIVENINNVLEKEPMKANDLVNNEKPSLKAIDNFSQAENKNLDGKPLILTNENQNPENLRKPALTNGINSGKNFTNRELIQKRRTLHAAYTFANKKHSTITPERVTPMRNKSIRKSILKTTLNSPSMFSNNLVRKRQVGFEMEKKRQSLFAGDKKRQSCFDGKRRQSSVQSQQRSLKIPAMGRECLSNVNDIAKKTEQNKIDRKKISVQKLSLPKLIEEPVVVSSSKRIKEQKLNLNSNKICQICLKEIPSSVFDLHEKVHKHKMIKLLKPETMKCDFCGKSFAFTQALDKHLIENCTKIPILQKRKLLNIKFAESQASAFTANAASNSSAESITTDNKKMPPPCSIQAEKKKVAHSGVWTPKKTLFCNICPDKVKFDNILQYSDHNLQFHND